jgi:RNA polymerase sigma-70 factor (ECF subfamily)
VEQHQAQAADLDALVDLLTDDVFLSMPPIPYQYRGRDLVLRFFGRLLAPARRALVPPTRANGQPAFGLYHRAPGGTAHAARLLVLGLSGGRVSTLTRFESSVLPRFGLPPVLPA